MKQLREEDRLLKNIRKIHMIGIGGSGMCPLAELLHSKGYTLTGSDSKESEQITRLRENGIQISIGQKAENVHGAELVAYSAAVPADNPERAEAERLGIPTMERSHLLGSLTRYYNNVIGVSGTHGKTTVTSMITQILLINKMQPNAVIGGKLPLTGTFGVTGDSETLVCESCEFVNSFLQFSPDISVLLNIDNDHLDFFKTMENLEDAFHQFVCLSEICYANGDDERVRRVTAEIPARVITYGMDDRNDYRATALQKGKRGFSFTVVKNGEELGTVDLKIPGRHNVYNALAAFAVCYDMGVSAAGIRQALAEFTGAGRRFEFLGECGFTVADDYAHHPTEMRASLEAAKDLAYNRVIVAFQPYTFSRVVLLKDGMVDALSLADKVFLTPIVAAREVNTHHVSSEDIAAELPGAEVIADYETLARRMTEEAQDNDIVLTMGAGDIYKVAHRILEMRKNEKYEN